ncbi:MAG TPA: sigma-70 family RNA polymerase sigma factor [Thermoanaerobaculia bacterium]|jgi:RNA polymerase sigma factor (TIGR02999 family)
MDDAISTVTGLLRNWSAGDRAALDSLLPLVQRSLHEIARGHLRHERADHSLEPSALVNELYLKLVDQRQVNWRDRVHFYGVAARLMRNILVDHARRRQSEKRGGELTRVTLSRAFTAGVDDERRLDVMVLNDALEQLERIFPQQGRIVELRYFAGMTIEETAEVLQISPATVKREWTMAKAWLRRNVTARVAVRGGV